MPNRKFTSPYFPNRATGKARNANARAFALRAPARTPVSIARPRESRRGNVRVMQRAPRVGAAHY